MVYEKSFSKKLIIYCSTHYRVLIGLLTFLLSLVSFYKIFPILLNPVIENGTIEAYDVKSSISSSRISGPYSNSSALDVQPTIEFQYESKTFHITGGSANRLFTKGEKTKVIFNQYSPNKACEFSFMGLIDFPVAYIAITIWFISSALLLGATAYTDDEE